MSFIHLSCNGSLNQVFKCYFGKMLYFLVVDARLKHLIDSSNQVFEMI